MKIEINNKIAVSDCRKDAVAAIKTGLTIENPAYLDAVKMGRYTRNIPSKLSFFETAGDCLIVPRGFFPALIGIAKEHGEQLRIFDHTRLLDPVSFKFDGQLRDYQKEACRAVFGRNTGVLNAPTGSGKTVMAAALIAARKQPALVVCHTKELLFQWRDRIKSFLDVEPAIIGDGRKEIATAPVVVGMVQTLVKCAGEANPRVGHLVVDECHRAPSKTFTEVVEAFDCRFVLGLSATPWRRDGLSKLIYWYLGPMVHEVGREALVSAGHIAAPEVVRRETAFRTRLDASAEYSRMLSELCMDAERNELIASDVAEEARNGGAPCLVLSDRKTHCTELARLLEERGVESELLTGDVRQRDRQRIVADLNEGKVKALIATGQLIGEGFDCKMLSTLFLATPVKFSGRVLQYVGRILRPEEGKRARVFDYVDAHIGVLKASAKSRAKVFAEVAECRKD